MLKRKPPRREKPVIDLDGPDGNVFTLIGTGVRLCKQLWKNPDKFREDMMSSDYTHAVRVFAAEFSDYVDLETDNEELIEAVAEKLRVKVTVRRNAA